MMKPFHKKIAGATLLIAMSFLILYYYWETPKIRNKEQWQQELNLLKVALDTLPNDLEKTTFLRKYCGRLMTVGMLSSETSNLYRSIDFRSFNPGKFYHLFVTDSIPADCGISSFFYIKLLEEFGYEAYQYSFGFKAPPYEDLVHSFCLVKINYKGSTRLIVQDPYLNLSYSDTEDEPIDFYSFLTLVVQKKYDDILMDSSTVTTNLIVRDTTQYAEFLSDSCFYEFKKRLVRPNGSWQRKMTINRNYQTLMNSACNSFENEFVNAMKAQGIDGPFLNAYLLKVADMVGSEGIHSIEEKIDSILFNTITDYTF